MSNLQTFQVCPFDNKKVMRWLVQCPITTAVPLYPPLLYEYLRPVVALEWLKAYMYNSFCADMVINFSWKDNAAQDDSELEAYPLSKDY